MQITQDVCPPASPLLATKVVPPVTPAMLADLLAEVERYGHLKKALHWELSSETVSSIGRDIIDFGSDLNSMYMWGLPIHVDLTKKGPYGALVSMHVAGT